MNQRHILLIAALALIASTSACSSSSSDSTTPAGQSFVVGQVGATSDTSDPVPINGLDLSFSEDPHAFDALFQ